MWLHLVPLGWGGGTLRLQTASRLGPAPYLQGRDILILPSWRGRKEEEGQHHQRILRTAYCCPSHLCTHRTEEGSNERVCRGRHNITVCRVTQFALDCIKRASQQPTLYSQCFQPPHHI